MHLDMPPCIWRRSKKNPMAYAPSLWLRADKGVYQDAAVQFTAADKSWLQIADAAQTGLDPGTDDILISLWAYVDSAAQYTRLVYKGADGGTLPGFNVAIDGSRYIYGMFCNGTTRYATTAVAGAVIPLATWQHIAVYYDRSGNMSLYINGALVAGAAVDISSFVAAAIDSSSAFKVGPNSDNSVFYDGRIDSLMFFKAADLSSVASAIIAWAYNSGAGRLCSEATAAQKAAWGAVSGWEHLEGMGTRYDSWGSNHLSQQFASLATNGAFTSDTTGWTAAGATLASVAGGQAGNCLEVTNAGDAAGYAHQAYTTVVGKLYTLTVYHKNGSGTGKILIGTAAGGSQNHNRSELNDADWTQQTVTFRATATTTYVSLSLATATSGQTTLWDTVSLTAAEILAAPGIARGVATDSNFAVQLNGSTQYLDYTGAAFDPGVGDFSVGCAFYVDTLGSTRTVFSAGSGAANNSYFAANISAAGALNVYFNDGNGDRLTMLSSETILVGKWYTFIIVGDRDGNLVGYLNGNSVISGSLASKSGVCAPGNLFFGRYAASAADYFPGRIDNAFYANRLLSAAEIAYLHNVGQWRQWAEIAADQPSLAAAMKGFWEGDDKTALGKDSTPNGNHLTPQGSPTQGMGVNYLEGMVSRWEDQSGGGKHATMTTLAKRPAYLSSGVNSRPVIFGDGVDDYLDVAAVDLTGAFAICAVFKCDVNPSSDTILGKDANNYVMLTDNTTVTVRIAGGTATAFTVGAIGTGTHMLTVTRDAANNVRVYLDGTESTTGAKALAGTLAITQLLAHGGDYFSGYVANVLVYAAEKSTGDLARIRRYLANLYGVTL